MGTQSSVGAQPPNFRPMSVVAKRSPVSAAGEHLFHDWVSLPVRELLGMGTGDKGGPLTGPQSEQNNSK